MGLFGLLNYEDYILNTLVQSNYARNSLIVLLMYIVTGLVRFHLSIIICSLVSSGSGTFPEFITKSFDLVFPVIVTVLLALISDTLFRYVETHRQRYEDIVDYFMTNYSRHNFFRWKRVFLLGICCYVLIAISLITIDNYFIFVCIMQTIAGFILCDILEHGLPRKCYIKLMNWWHKPHVIKFTGDTIHGCIIINEYPENPNIKPFHDTYSHNNHPQLRQINTDATSNYEIQPSVVSAPDLLSNNDIKNLHNKSSSTDKIPLGHSEKFNESMEKVVPIPAKPPTPPMLKYPRYKLTRDPVH